MLRDFIRLHDTSPLRQILARFKLELPETAGYCTLLEFRMLTPDSFLWKLLINGTIYYLYVEDFVESIATIHHKLAATLKESPALEFVEAKEPTQFKTAAPVKAAALYKRPENTTELMKYAVDSGYDFVFLCRSDEDSSNAYFNS